MPILDYIWYELGDFFGTGSQRSAIFKDFTEGEMLAYKVNGVTNLDSIYQFLGNKDKQRTKTVYESFKSTIESGNIEAIKKLDWGPGAPGWPSEMKYAFRIGTLVAIPKDKVNRSIAARDGGTRQIAGGLRNDVPYQNTRVFFAKSLKEAINQEWYNQKIEIESKQQGNQVKKSFPKNSVWIWSRAMLDENYGGIGGELYGKWINVSKYIEVVSFNTTDNGGNFNFTLAPIRASYDTIEEYWDTDRDLLHFIDKGGIDDGIVAKTSTHQIVDGKRIRSDFLFDLILQQNDVVAINLMPTHLRRRDRDYEAQDRKYMEENYPEYHWSAVPDGVVTKQASGTPSSWLDMIGLIDSVEKSYDARSNSVSISVSGRDLSKLLIEDGSYMYTSLWSGHNFFLEREEGIIQRNLGGGARMVYNFFSEPRFRTIAEAVKFVINIASYIKIAPGERMLGDSEGSKTESKWSSVVDGEEFFTTEIRSDYNGIWKSVKLAFDKKVENRKLADVSLGSPDGSLLDLMRNYTQAPWVEMVMDTYDEHFYITFRQPPHDKESLVEYINSEFFKKWMYVEEKDVLSDSLSFDTRSYSLYQLDYKAATWGGAQTIATIVPTVPLPDYAEVYGNKQWRMSSNLLPFEGADDIGSIGNQAYVRDRGIEDLMYAIETTCYLPFTRKGSITINQDRRWKKGMWFHYHPTNEVFYIVAVSHTTSYQNSVESTTTLTVERGMVFDFIQGRSVNDPKTGDTFEPSYFSIIDIERLETYLKTPVPPSTPQSETTEEEQPEEVAETTETETTEEVDFQEVEEPLGETEFGKAGLFGDKKSQTKVRNNFRVDKKVFNFFLRRAQFSRKTVKTNPPVSTTPNFGKESSITNLS
jgi:hypothetical protein